MNDAIEVSYTGDLLAHRRCARAWAYEKQVGFEPYEAVQAMEGRLVHHAMEWLTREFVERHKRERHATFAETRDQLVHYFRVLWARGIRTAFASKQETIDRVMENLFPAGEMDEVVRAAIEGARHSEYELRSVRKVLPAEFGGKSRILLTGILDLVVQQQAPLLYRRTWVWDRSVEVSGTVSASSITAKEGDVEIWDYKATRSGSSYVDDYVRQLLTYAALYRERTGRLPVRCVVFFVNERSRAKRLLAIETSDELVEAALSWTHKQVRELRASALMLQADPETVPAGELALRERPLGKRLGSEAIQQCTTCSFRFSCQEYIEHLGGDPAHNDVNILNVLKN